MRDAIVDEFANELGDLARACEGDAHAELDALWIVGIEREAIVTVAYRHSVIEQRLASMAVDPEVRAVISRAVRWAWRDEQAHTLWVRGALLRRGDLGTRARAISAQIEGWVGGWVSSRQNHHAWIDAPVSRLLAEGIEAIGAVSGRIPPAVRSALHWNTFADFCRFNRSAETTAAMAWRRMQELAISIGDREEAEGFARMAEDEERHAKIFGVLAEAFDAEDRFAKSADELRAELQRVGQRFVARPDAHAPAWRNPLGKGGKVALREDDDCERAVGEVLDAIGIASLLGDRAKVVALKTTFMLLTRREDPSPAVSLRVLSAVIAWLRARGAVVRVIDARNLYDRFHGGRSVAEVARYLGIDAEVVDAQSDQIPHAYTRGMGQDSVSRAWRDADVRLILGKLRSHPTSSALLSLEAAEGLGERVDDHLFVDRRSERETSILMALDAFPPHAALLDAFENVPDGLLGVFGSRAPIHPRRIYGSLDAVALDTVASRHIGGDPAREGTLVAEAFDWFGDPRYAIEIDGIDALIEGFRLPDHSARTAFLSALALPVFTHASARGELFLPEFDEAAFPPLAKGSSIGAAARAAIRRIVEDAREHQGERGELLRTSVVHAGAAIRLARIGRGAPLVCLHGYPETLQVFARLARKLAPERDVIAFDWPGLGYSSEIPGPSDPDSLADQLRAVLDALGLAKVDLLGADMGAPPALVFASRFPERVGRVIATSSLLFGDEKTSVEISIMRRAGLAGAAFRVAHELVYARCKKTFLPDGEALPPELDRDFWNAFHRPEVRAHLARMCADYERALPDLPARYWKIECPVELLWAEHDGHFPARQAERLCELLPNAKCTVIEDARHWMAITRADEVAAHVKAFLAGSRA